MHPITIERVDLSSTENHVMAVQDELDSLAHANRLAVGVSSDGRRRFEGKEMAMLLAEATDLRHDLVPLRFHLSEFAPSGVSAADVLEGGPFGPL